ncbi:MAG: TRAP transporter fused permease subunit [Chloroflexota bacterium]
MGEARPVTRERKQGLSRYALMPLPIKVIFLVGPVVATILFILHWFSVPVFGTILSSTPYYYLLLTVLAFNIFMGLGASMRRRRQPPPWYDYILATATLGCMVYFLMNSTEIAARNWDRPPGLTQFAFAIILGLLALESGRRIGGWPLVIVYLVAIAYPMVAERMPGIFYAISFNFTEVIGYYAYSAGGILGLPSQLFGELVLGFYLFAGMMMGLGGGEFFLKLATAISGHFRGGPAKVSVIASGFFGSLSGSIIANIAGTGAFTIPAMKRLGYSPEYAAAIETCASSGGDTMPPIMGGIAFLVVVIAGVEYADIMVAAFLPTFLHYFALLVQVDSYAVRHKIHGLPRNECPRIGQVLQNGWLYLLIILFLVFGLVYMRWDAITPIYAIGLTILLQLATWGVKRVALAIRRQSEPEMSLANSARRALTKMETSLSEAAGLINYGAAIFIGVPFVLIGLNQTGFSAGLTNYVVSLGGQNIYLILFVTFAFCIVMGMVGLGRAAYLFLAVTMAPALVALGKVAPEFQASGGISILAVHLFLIFYVGVGGFTPPVAIHAFVAASLAGASPMKTAWMSCRLGIALILVPFFFVLRPAILIVNTEWYLVILSLFLVLIGIWFLASGLERYIVGAGKLALPARISMMIGGFLFAFPETVTTIIGGIICIIAYIYTMFRNRRERVAAIVV